MRHALYTIQPPQRGWPGLRQFVPFVLLSCRALLELARARLRFAHFSVREIEALNAAARKQGGELEDGQRRLLGWIAYVVPRIARIAPWRSDCLVQALAAHRWLAAHRIGSEIVIGVDHPQGGPFGAHAWLKCGEMMVTGGEVDRYTVILD